MRSRALLAAASCAVLLLPGSPRAGADPAAAAGVPPELDALLARMAASRGVVADFVEEKELALLAAPLESRGRLYFVPPDRLARFTFEPAPSLLLLDAGELRYRDAGDGDDLDLSGTPQARAFAENFVALFRGDLELLRRSYRVSHAAAGTGFELRLEPRRAPLRRFVARISLRGGPQGLREMELVETDGDRTRTRFRNVALDRAFEAEEIADLFERGRVPEGDPPPAP